VIFDRAHYQRPLSIQGVASTVASNCAAPVHTRRLICSGRTGQQRDRLLLTCKPSFAARFASIAPFIADLTVLVARPWLFTTARLWNVHVGVERATICHTESPSFSNVRYKRFSVNRESRRKDYTHHMVFFISARHNIVRPSGVRKCFGSL